MSCTSDTTCPWATSLAKRCTTAGKSSGVPPLSPSPAMTWAKSSGIEYVSSDRETTTTQRAGGSLNSPSARNAQWFLRGLRRPPRSSCRRTTSYFESRGPKTSRAFASATASAPTGGAPSAVSGAESFTRMPPIAQPGQTTSTRHTSAVHSTLDCTTSGTVAVAIDASGQ
jgi:hypothetical protein